MTIDDATIKSDLVYHHSVLSAVSGGAAAPEWFAPAMDAALQPIEDRLKTLEDKVDRLKNLEDKVDDMRNTLVGLTISTAKNHNRNLRDGKVTAFVPVLFPDGTMPFDNNNAIKNINPSTRLNTPLTSASVIAALTRNELLEYCNGYYGNKKYTAGAAGTTERLADLRNASRVHCL
ncbi:hypothetical protein DFH09DRAFT_1188747 [Mycena vulgaris]|nr:hypothetical protein DFH09DRAFT_1188747 [Mycena vulgaris]